MATAEGFWHTAKMDNDLTEESLPFSTLIYADWHEGQMFTQESGKPNRYYNMGKAGKRRNRSVDRQPTRREGRKIRTRPMTMTKAGTGFLYYCGTVVLRMTDGSFGGYTSCMPMTFTDRTGAESGGEKEKPEMGYIDQGCITDLLLFSFLWLY